MHEVSLVQLLLQQAREVAVAQGGLAIEEIRVEIGPLSGVEPLLVSSAFDRLVAESSLHGARLVIDEVSLEAHCHDCGTNFELQDFRFECPGCKSRRVHVVRGDEFRLVSITVCEMVDDGLMETT